jgi:hypothetical protein
MASRSKGEPNNSHSWNKTTTIEFIVTRTKPLKFHPGAALHNQSIHNGILPLQDCSVKEGENEEKVGRGNIEGNLKLSAEYL